MEGQVSEGHTQLGGNALVGVLCDVAHVFQHGGSEGGMCLHWQLPKVELWMNTGQVK